MITYTTRTIINDVADLKYLHAADSKKEGDEKASLQYDPSDAIGLLVDGHFEFNKDYVTSINLMFPQEEVFASYELDFTAGSLKAALDDEAKTMRIEMWLTPDQVYPSEYALGDTTFGKPIIFEFNTTKTDGTVDAETAVKNAVKSLEALNKFGNVVVTAEADGTTLKLEAKSYLDFRDVIVSRSCEDGFIVRFQALAMEEDTEYKKTLHVPAVFTYEYLLGAVRFPTCENTGWGIPNADREPIRGAKYAQLSIKMCADRGPLGAAHIGQKIHSMTEHIFYVNAALLKDGAILDKEGSDWLANGGFSMEDLTVNGENVGKKYDVEESSSNGTSGEGGNGSNP